MPPLVARSQRPRSGLTTTGLDADAVALARFLYALRGARHAIIGGDLLGEPAWDMLLDLYVATGDARRLSVTSLCIGSQSAAATALRYLGLLEEHGLVERLPDPTDARRCFVALTDAGRSKMESILLPTLRGDRADPHSGALP